MNPHHRGSILPAPPSLARAHSPASMLQGHAEPIPHTLADVEFIVAGVDSNCAPVLSGIHVAQTMQDLIRAGRVSSQ